MPVSTDTPNATATEIAERRATHVVDEHVAEAPSALVLPARRVRRPRRRFRSALDVLVVGAITYGGAVVLNAHHLHRRAEQLPLDSPVRGMALALTGALDRASALVGLDQPGAAIDSTRHLAPAARGGDGSAVAVSTVASASPDATSLSASPPAVAERPGEAARAQRLIASLRRERSDPDPLSAARTRVGRRSSARPPRLPRLLDAPQWQRLTGDAAAAVAVARAHPASDTSTNAAVTGSASTTVTTTTVTATTSATTTGTTATTATTTGTATAAGTTATTASAALGPELMTAPLRRPTPDQPWRVYVGGDSLAQGIGPALERVAADGGLMKVQPRGVLSSGLSRPDAFDWFTELRIVAASDDEIVVVVFGANDPQALSTADGTVAFGTPAWTVEYRRRVDLVLETLRDKTVVWVGLPVVGRSELEAQLAVLDRIYRDETTRYVNASYVDVRALTSPDGVTYTPYLDRGDGQEFLARTNDKVHFTTAGYDLVANAVAMRLLQLTGPG